MSCIAIKVVFGVSKPVLHKLACTGSLKKKDRSLKFWICVEELLCYLCSEKKGADQLCSYCTADLCLCFRLGKNSVSHDTAYGVNEDNSSRM